MIKQRLDPMDRLRKVQEVLVGDAIRWHASGCMRVCSIIFKRCARWSGRFWGRARNDPRRTKR